jgi:hypothetical protein
MSPFWTDTLSLRSISRAITYEKSEACNLTSLLRLSIAVVRSRSLKDDVPIVCLVEILVVLLELGNSLILFLRSANAYLVILPINE